jgi:hypothetical protein
MHVGTVLLRLRLLLLLLLLLTSVTFARWKCALGAEQLVNCARWATLIGSQEPLLLLVGGTPKQKGVPGCSETMVLPRNAHRLDVLPQSAPMIAAPVLELYAPPCPRAMLRQ